MANIELKETLLRSIQQLTLIQQLRLLEFIDSLLGLKKGGEPKGFLKFVGAIPSHDLKEMESAIKDCEQIDEDEW